MQKGKDEDFNKPSLFGLRGKGSQESRGGEEEKEQNKNAEKNRHTEGKAAINGDIGVKFCQKRRVFNDRKGHVNGDENHQNAIAAKGDAIDKTGNHKKDDNEKIPRGLHALKDRKKVLRLKILEKIHG